MNKSGFTIFLTLVLVAVFSTFAVAQSLHKLPKPIHSTSDNSKLALQELNHTDSGWEYYLGSGAAGDTFAVWYKGAGACSVYTVESVWFNGDGAASVLFYAWETSNDPNLGDPGFASDDWGGTTPLGAVSAGPIPFAPATGFDWQPINFADFGVVPFYGDMSGTPAPFLVGFVKNSDVPNPLADDEGARGFVYTWFGGPWTSGAWGDYNPIIEVGMRVWVSYPYGAAPNIASVQQLPNTFDGGQNFSVMSTITDDGTVTMAKLLYAVNGTTPTDTVAMTDMGGGDWMGTFNPAAGVGDVVSYWVWAEDNDGQSSVSLIANTFEVVAPNNPGASVLVVDDGGVIDMAMFTDILDARGVSWDYWDVAANNGIDKSVTTAGWTGAVVFGWGTSTVPTRAYSADHPWAAFLNAGGSMFYTDQDYYFTNGEVASPTFASGDFAYDFFGQSSGENDPGRDVDTLVIGASGDPLTDFASADFVPMRPEDLGVQNWVDYINDGLGDFIWTGESGFDCAYKYDSGTFKTVSVLFAVEALNDTTVLDSPRVYSSTYTTFLNNAFDWLGIVSSVESLGGEVPASFALEQNYPNPFNPVTSIKYSLPQAADVNLTVYSLTGQKITTLVSQKQSAGSYKVTWDGTNSSGARVSSGVYMYRIEAGDHVANRKMILIK